MKYQDIDKRIKKVREMEGLKQSEFSEILQISSVHISRLENGAREPSRQLIELIINRFDINRDWFLYGTGEPKNEVNLTGEKLKLYEELEDLNSDEIHMILKIIKDIKAFKYMGKEATADRTATRVHEPMEEVASYAQPIAELETYKKIRILGKVAAGFPILAIPEYEYIDGPVRADFAVLISGESMEPTINNEDIIFVKEQPDLENGEIGIVEIIESGEITQVVCKRFYRKNGHVELVSDNEAYESIIITSDDIKILGKVLV